MRGRDHRANPKSERDVQINRQGAILSAMMLAGLVAVLAGALRRFLPGWEPAYLVAASFLVALEASLIHHVLRRDRMWLDELARYLVPELFVMLVLMRVATSLSIGVATLGANARVWLYDPLRIFDPPFLGAIVLGLLVGALAHAAMRDLFELAPRLSETPAVLADEVRVGLIISTEERAAALRRISGRFIFGGVFLLLSLGLEAVNIERIADASLPISSLSAGGALVYLVSGFLLYSQGRLALLQARWQLDGARVATNVPSRWTRISWIIVAGVACAAALLPRTYGLGLLATIQGALGLIGFGIALIGYAITTLLSLLAILPIWLISLLTGGAQQSAPAPSVEPPPRLPPAPPAAAFEPRLLTALVFWVCMFALVGYALWIVVQRHPGMIRALTTRGPLAWLLRQLGWLWRDTRSWAGQMTQRAVTLLQRRASVRPNRVPSLRLRRLAPRELVRYFYRSTLRRAAAAGLARRSGQTPYEYRALLAGRIPDAEQDIAEMTDAFVVAEYSPRPIEAADARRVRQPWERLRRRLRAMVAQRTDDEGRGTEV
jgi:hypothetical protein